MIVNFQASGGGEDLEDIFQLHQLIHISRHNHECIIGILDYGVFLPKVIINREVNQTSVPSIIYSSLK
jgi:hypothetical protein